MLCVPLGAVIATAMGGGVELPHPDRPSRKRADNPHSSAGAKIFFEDIESLHQ
jgi:hypothetical protein